MIQDALSLSKLCTRTMKIAQAQVRGTSLTKDEVIKTAVLDLMQSFMDEALEGHYDDVAWRDQTLVVTDFMGEEVGTVGARGCRL